MSQLLTVPTWTVACGRVIGQARRPLKLLSPSQSSENRPQRSSLNGTSDATVWEAALQEAISRVLPTAVATLREGISPINHRRTTHCPLNAVDR
ncbi:hypothetical protein [Cylindrospermum stagnale]|uniref:hypothetical protein n=1 Tax=Cylindrospermum stagnale TaxID=142864 RepID=UPI0012F69E85|nr:hypothetical protein [Cylindrospermum stagnale]